MKFICSKCCDETQTEPCTLIIPKDPHRSKKDIIAGLTICPFEGMNYHKGVWETNGETFNAEWREMKK